VAICHCVFRLDCAPWLDVADLQRIIRLLAVLKAFFIYVPAQIKRRWQYQQISTRISGLFQAFFEK
jgi:hypothetical protein